MSNFPLKGNYTPSAAPSKVPYIPASVTAEKVVANFSLATSQLVELIGECKDNSKQLSSVDDRLSALEKKVPAPPSNMATTGDLGKAMTTMRAEIEEMKKQIMDEIKVLRADRETFLKELFSTTTHVDSFRSTLQSAVSTLVKGTSDILHHFDTGISSILGFDEQKK